MAKPAGLAGTAAVCDEGELSGGSPPAESCQPAREPLRAGRGEGELPSAKRSGCQPGGGATGTGISRLSLVRLCWARLGLGRARRRAVGSRSRGGLAGIGCPVIAAVEIGENRIRERYRQRGTEMCLPGWIGVRGGLKSRKQQYRALPSKDGVCARVLG